MVAKVDTASSRRIQPADQKRLIRALEVFFLTKRPLTDHFAETRSPLSGSRVTSFALRLRPREIARRVSERVNQQFERGYSMKFDVCVTTAFGSMHIRSAVSCIGRRSSI